MPRIVTVLIVLATGSTSVRAGPPVIESHNPAGSDFFWSTTSTEYVDIPGTEKTVTVPTGSAVITWSLWTHTAGARVRPVIGTQTPPNGMRFPINTLGGMSGSWATTIEGGTIPVKLQVAVGPPDPSGFNTYQGSCTWTLVVFPTADGNVPAVGGIGLAVLVVAVMLGGALVLSRRSVVA